ncbi:hypothetical protein KDA_21670 [Dictyobacter alpinus]|uniref:Uncharacterized protein n=1 Tax=Dictyobacter alpinus TaxID=2014873 RepID=A0A402B5R0_9CHLR|nr:hypothetical protein [Dictyobacter alpinus]GCE26683.1 hypothetical protein KDA_21670 [Dictyobacter alpinus]
MKRRYTRAIQLCWVFLLALLLIGMAAPVNATPTEVRQPQAGGMLETKVYLTQDVLRQRFQDSINQQVPGITANTVNNILNGSPAGDQGWIKSIANTLISPTVTLTGLKAQSNGFDAGLTLSLYSGDPKPTTSHMLVTFNVLNASTIQVNGSSLPGSQALMTGQLTTIQVPIGKLTSVRSITNCGAASLEMGLQLPMDANSKSQGSVPAPYQLATTNFVQSPTNVGSSPTRMLALSSQTVVAQAVPVYVEVPFSSLSAIASGVGELPINNSMTAKNIKLSMQNGKLVVTADIISLVFGTPLLKLGTATTILEPQAANGKLRLHVDQTRLSVLIFTFNADSYNQQIEQSLNNQIGNAINSGLTINGASMGANNQITCAAPDSMLLTGSTSIN